MTRRKRCVDIGLLEHFIKDVVHAVSVDADRELLQVLKELRTLSLQRELLPAFGHDESVYNLKPPDCRHEYRSAINDGLKDSICVRRALVLKTPSGGD